jgi:hypothetical protein
LESAAAAQSGSSVIAGIFRLVQIEQTNFNCMEDYVTAVSNQSQLLRNQQVEIPDIVIAALMIHGLSDDYATQKALLEDKSREELTSEYVRTKLLEAEKNMQAEVPEKAYAVTLRRRRFGLVPTEPPRERNGPLCTYCGRGGHSTEKCWTRMTDDWRKKYPDTEVPNWKQLTRKRTAEAPERKEPQKDEKANMVVFGIDPPSEDEGERERANMVCSEEALPATTNVYNPGKKQRCATHRTYDTHNYCAGRDGSSPAHPEECSAPQ